MAAPYFLRTFNIPLFVPLPYFIRGHFVNFSTRRINLYIHKATFLSLVKTAALLLRLFKYFSVSMFISLPFLTSLTFLLGLLSAVLIAVAFRHLATKPLFYFACFYFYFAVFSRRGYCRLAAIFLPCHFQRCRPFYRCSASNIAAFHSRLDLELPFFALVQSSLY